MFSRLFGSPRQEEVRFAAPSGSRLYVVGDIHGRADLLSDMHRMIRADRESNLPDRAVVIYLGDYIDRGAASSDVLDIILNEPLQGFEAVHLLGNHEDFMLAFLQNPAIGDLWLKNGGDATMYSYGVGLPQVSDRDERHRVMRDQLEGKLPEPHLQFLKSLKLLHIEGDYAFVHAGIKPGRDLSEQVPDDVLWIREEFLGSNANHGKCIVHGHTITDEVEIRPNRIGIDTGAYFSGKLTCLVLSADTRSLLQT